MGIKFRHKGNLKKTEDFLKKAKNTDFFKHLDDFGREGVAALTAATPIDSGLTAASWSYEIFKTPDDCAIYWSNTNINDGVNIAVILQYGHGTRNGGYVQGRDYINPAIAPVFDRIAEDAWQEVQNM